MKEQRNKIKNSQHYSNGSIEIWRRTLCTEKQTEEKRLEAAQMKFLRHLLGIKELHKENNV